MRINVYSQELTPEIDRVTKWAPNMAGEPQQFHAVRLYLHSTPLLHHTAQDDDRSAITLWLPRSLPRRVELAVSLRALAGWIEGEWPGGWEGVHTDRAKARAGECTCEHPLSASHPEYCPAGEADRPGLTEAKTKAGAGGITYQAGDPAPAGWGDRPLSADEARQLNLQGGPVV